MRWVRLALALVWVAVMASPAVAGSTLWDIYHKKGAQHYERGEYSQAAAMLRLALEEAEANGDLADVATTLNNLALLYKNLGKYAEAEPLYSRALAIREKALGPDHPEVC